MSFNLTEDERSKLDAILRAQLAESHKRQDSTVSNLSNEEREQIRLSLGQVLEDMLSQPPSKRRLDRFAYWIGMIAGHVVSFMLDVVAFIQHHLLGRTFHSFKSRRLLSLVGTIIPFIALALKRCKNGRRQ